MSGLILVTGATGKTGRSLIAQLEAKGVPYRAASRTGQSPFDWTRPQTWEPALEGVASVYLVAPGTVDDPYSRIIDFMGSAMRTGRRRFVFLGMASLPAGGPAHGQAHQWLKDNSDDWAVLRPSGFMENFSEGPYLATIREEDTVYSNTGRGRVPFICVKDIASAALEALTSPTPLNRDFTLTGYESISYDQVAETVSRACGRQITHTHISTEALIDRFLARGLAETTARLLAFGYQTIAAGYQDRTTQDLEGLLGRRPMTFEAFTEANAEIWNRIPGPTPTAN